MALAQKEMKKSGPAPITSQPKAPAPAPAATEPKAPACPPQKAPECPKLTLAELEKKGNSFKLSVADDTQIFGNPAPEILEFEVIPKNMKDGVEKGINILS